MISLELSLTALVSSFAATSLLGVILTMLIKQWIDAQLNIRLERLKLQNSQDLAHLSAELETAKQINKLLAEKRLAFIQK